MHIQRQKLINKNKKQVDTLANVSEVIVSLLDEFLFLFWLSAFSKKKNMITKKIQSTVLACSKEKKTKRAIDSQCRWKNRATHLPDHVDTIYISCFTVVCQ